MLMLRERSKVAPNDVELVTLRVNPLVRELTGKVLPPSGLEGKFSVGFVCALALVTGMVVPSLFRDELAIDPVFVDLQRRIRFIVDESVGQDQATATALMRDGSEIDVEVQAALGSLGRPMTADDVESKSATLVAPSLGVERASHLRDLCRHPERLRSVARFVEAIVLEV